MSVTPAMAFVSPRAITRHPETRLWDGERDRQAGQDKSRGVEWHAVGCTTLHFGCHGHEEQEEHMNRGRCSLPDDTECQTR